MWSPHQYKLDGIGKRVPDEVLNRAIEQIENVVLGDFQLPAILSLNHLSQRAKVPYQYLRGVVGRTEQGGYRKFSIKKRSGGRRFIHVPEPSLGHVQKWINRFILRGVPTHSASYAFAPGSSIFKCASRHCGAQWLVKMDITGFFESISEIQVFRVFRGLGYQPLVAFELARIVTISPAEMSRRHSDPVWKVRNRNKTISLYSSRALGYLPQGAPTSPMISNLVMKDIDEQISLTAKSAGLVYTRYSDDLTFSTADKNFGREAAKALIADIEKILSSAGFRPQHRKTTIVPPGARKIVLGLVVDGVTPRLRREFKDNLRSHFYYLEKFGPLEHAKARNFQTIWGLKSHLRGLIAFAKMIQPDYADAMLQRFNKVAWPY